MAALRRAFTLIELLVVIAIIAILMAVLMPTLGAVRKHARGSACQSNLRQMCLAMNLYALDHDDRTMPFTHQMGRYWFHQLAPYLSAKDYKNNPQEHIKGVMEVAFCPMTKRQQRSGDSYYGTAELTWKFLGGEGSYGLNLWLQPNDPIYRKDLPGQKENFFEKYSDAGGSVPVLGDSVWVGAWPYRDDQAPGDLTGTKGYPNYPHGQGYFMGRFCIDRHRMAINLGFVDTHAERVPLKELWAQKWHRGFVPNPEITLP
ncbi:MAG: type II secretion system protein [Planctomycetes bacterium]|nr:type II secretion system protein [Planctomycetota bacterium]